MATGDLLPFCQAVHECAGFTSRRWVSNLNPTGLGATNDGAEGARFTTPEDGIEASLGHLLAYALTDLEASSCQMALILKSPRLHKLEELGRRGVAKTWEGLNGRWAVPGSSYGQSIVKLSRQIIDW